jgi:cell division cycle 14
MFASIDSKSVEIIKDKLYWISDKNPPKNQPNAFFFNIDNDLVYQPFFADFGPLDMGKTYRFITELEKLLQDATYSKSRFYHHTSLDNAKRTNAACLMGCFQIIILGRSAEEAWEPFAKAQPPLAEYRDAGYTNSPYRCSILDCLRGLEYAIKLKWFDLKSFNLRDYEFYEKVENGDLNWIIPGKFIAFSGPSDAPRDAEGYRRFTPEDYVPIFKKFGVTNVVRLNNKQYEGERFKKNGIKHTDLYFLDGSCPSDEIIENFLRICEAEKGAVAVHCKAGLGRTGSLIAAYAMKHYKFLAADFIGYIRLCRPGSVLGPQQQFLIDKQPMFHKMNETSPLFKTISHLIVDFHSKRDSLCIDYDSPKKEEMSPLDKKIAKYGDHGQANRLLDAKFKGRVSTDTSPADTPTKSTTSGSTGNSSTKSSGKYTYPTATSGTNYK